MLREAEASVRGRLKFDEVAENPRLKSWREAYRSFGAKPSEFRSSIEALVRRVLATSPCLPSMPWSISGMSFRCDIWSRPGGTPSIY